MSFGIVLLKKGNQSMSTLKEVHPNKLDNRHDRACAKLARIARGDTIWGGAKALVIAKRAEAMGVQFPALAVVTDVYHASNYSCGPWAAYECPECGTVHLGEESALNCCNP